jgi:multiple sugar transport system ATP-binding protein
MATVVLEHVSKVYEGGVRAVDDVNVTIHDKDFLVLVGPSGCGKSTTLRMIAGLEEISEGVIKIDGRVINDVPPKDRDIAMVFQNYALYPHMSVRENMAFGLKLRRFQKAEIEKRVKEAAEILELSPYLDRKPKALSGGQRQRVALGRAIVRKPKVFLFDEPLSNLDAKLRGQMRGEIMRLHHRLGATIVYVTHDQVEAMTMGTRIVVLKDGIMQQVDPPIELFNKPNNQFVAGFIGSPSMNFIEGQVTNGLFESSSIAYKLTASEKKRVEAGMKAVLGIRPQDFEVSKSSKGKGIIVGTVDIAETLGSETYLHVQTGAEKLVAQVDPDTKYKLGGPIELRFDPKKAHLFDGSSGIVVR